MTTPPPAQVSASNRAPSVSTCTAAAVVTPDRSIFRGKRYLPMRLVEFARGCRFKCDFCAIQSIFQATHNHRPIDVVIREVRRILVEHGRDELVSRTDQGNHRGLESDPRLEGRGPRKHELQ